MSNNWFHGIANMTLNQIDTTMTIHLPVEEGKVGIGVCSPWARLHVYANNPHYPVFMAEGKKFSLPGNGYQGIFVRWDGRVGICQNLIGSDYETPSRLTLDVRGDARFSALNSTKRYIRIGYDGANGLIEFFSDKQGEALLFNYYSGRNIGLGNSSSMVGVPGQLIVGNAASLPNMAGYKLGVGGNAYINGIAIGYNGYDGFIEYGGSGSLLINYTTQKPITLGGGNTIVKVPGKLAIGDVWNAAGAAPYNLAVEGWAIMERCRVLKQPFWPDEVFEKDYPLMPLDSLENFIKTYKHLPEIPTKETIQKEGIDVGAMNALLLKKIEELTLYILQQQKEIERLNKELKQLRLEMRKLSSQK